MELFSESYLTIALPFNGAFVDNFIQTYYDFIINTPKRVLANYVGWRVIQSSINFMNIEMRNAYLKFQKIALGKEDIEQRWKLCALLTQSVAPIATGSLYIDEYFKKEDKESAVKLADSLLTEYSATIENSTWMDNQTKKAAHNTARTMTKYIGYEDGLREKEANNFYNDLHQHPEENFLEMGLAFKIFDADRKYKRIFTKDKNDWTKYSKTATINAYYNSKDNSIRKSNYLILYLIT